LNSVYSRSRPHGANASLDDFRLVRQLRDLEEFATVAACEAWQRRLLDALARHFPEQELAIRAVAAHVIGTVATATRSGANPPVGTMGDRVGQLLLTLHCRGLLR
jgi:hypothetical protein